MNTPTKSPTPFPPSTVHAATVDAPLRAAKQAADPDEGWTFTSGRRLPFKRHFHRSVDRRPPFYARALRSGRDEWADGLSEADAIAKLRSRLGLVSIGPTQPAPPSSR